MKNSTLRFMAAAAVLSPALALAQANKPKPTTATYIMKEEIDKIRASQQGKAVSDENSKVIDLGPKNSPAGVVPPSSPPNPPPAPAANANAAPAAPAEKCGRVMATMP